jgi:hypothetical protein
MQNGARAVGRGYAAPACSEWAWSRCGVGDGPSGAARWWGQVVMGACATVVPLCTVRVRGFFYFDHFFKNQEINPSEIYFQVLPLSNCVSQVGMTHEVVVSCALARLTSI